jgi:outer membrane protein TolC
MAFVRRAVVWLLIGGTGLAAVAGPGLAQDRLPVPVVPLLPQEVRTTQPPAKDADTPADAKKADEKKDKPAWKAWQPPGQPLTLGQCLQIGQERHPSIHAAQATLAASERGYLALLNFKRPILAEWLSPDLPYRRQQAQRGIAAATADVLLARQNNTYDVTRLYYSYIFATQQEQTASEIVEQMETFYEAAVEILKLELPPDPKGPKINEFTIGTLDSVISEVRDLREEASVGRKKAIAALKQAMAVEPEFDLVPADKELPLLTGGVTKEQVVAAALAARPELTQAAVLLDVTRLEVCAQAKQTRKQQVPTFASGADLHARHIPAPIRNGEYRPGAIPPQMPIQLVGQVQDRVARATEFVRHQEAVYANVVSLVRLEAENTFLDWEAAAAKVAQAKSRHERAQVLLEKSRAAAATKMDPELLVKNEAEASRAQARYVDAVFKHIRALITLEKVTAGGVVPAFQGR